MRRNEQDRRLAAEIRAQRRVALSPTARRKRTLGWPMVVAGMFLFVATQVANFSNHILLPFDRHHFFGQFGGLVLAVIGANWATRRS
jgi:hypothetical protein